MVPFCLQYFFLIFWFLFNWEIDRKRGKRALKTLVCALLLFTSIQFTQFRLEFYSLLLFLKRQMAFFSIELYTQRNVGPNSIAIFYVSVCVPVRVFVFYYRRIFFVSLFYFVTNLVSKCFMKRKILTSVASDSCQLAILSGDHNDTIQFVFISFFSLKATSFLLLSSVCDQNDYFLFLALSSYPVEQN